MDLLEREGALQQLEQALDDAMRGAGRVALISGEAGIGKSCLIEQFTRRAKVRSLWGACDALFSPRPLGPLHDIAAQTQNALATHLANGADRSALFNAMLSELQGRPVIAVFEDVHWADDATLDLLRFLVRRISRTTALLVLTYRDDELRPGHPLRAVLGDLASSGAALRLPLSPLSQRAVRVLVGHRAIDPTALHQRTGGNPFFVTEVLSNDGDGLPSTVRDAVLGRVARLSRAAHVVLDAAAVIGPRVEPWLLEAMVPSDAEAADECLAGGVLVAHGDSLAFRHELARHAVLEAIPPLRRVNLHRLALEALRDAPHTDLTRLAHHAQAAGDRDAILTYAPDAAREAAAAGAHRTAKALLEVVLKSAIGLPAAQYAALLEAHAWECHLVADMPGAIAARRQAIDLWRDAGEPLRQGENLAMLAGVLSSAGRRDEARRAAQAAIDLLMPLPSGREQALAYATRAMLYQYNHDLANAIGLAERAVEIAERVGDVHIQSVAYDTRGLATMYLDYERGCGYLEHARSIAQAAGLDSDVARAYGDLGSISIELFHLERAERYLADGLAYATERDLERSRLYMVGWLAAAHFFRGRWPDAAATAGEVLASPAVSSNARLAALVTLGRLQARRGDRDSGPQPLDAALELAGASDEFQLIGPVRAARAEAAWLAGDTARTLAEADAAYTLAIDRRHQWLTGELAFWRWRAGAMDTPPDWIAPPYALHIAGQWHAAAEAWRERGCPYESARALADGDAVAQEQALLTFDSLGARPAAASVRRALRLRGVVRTPRGPRPSTRANKFGLTPRQLEILSLVAEGLSNAEIAERLSIAPKTAEHHVAAVLAKLDVRSRRAAVRLARSEQLCV